MLVLIFYDIMNIEKLQLFDVFLRFICDVFHKYLYSNDL
ncbi:hypothetical protein E4N77_05550 [Treponema denticola]|nr:hypothetical protein E4N77_05550 [Treponema denticola]